MSEIPNWWMKGDWFDVCSCGIPCPCTFAQPPNGPPGDQCDGLLAWHINEGVFGGDLRLDGLNVIEVSRFSGNIWAGAKTVVAGMFIDDRANRAQREALELIWSGRAGGFMEKFCGNIVEHRGFVAAPIEFELAEDLAYWRARIPEHLEMRGEALTGPTCPDGARVQLYNPPGSETGPNSGPVTWGVAKQNDVSAFDFNWDWSGRSSKHIPFDWTGP